MSGRRIGHNHCDRDTYLGTDGCDIERGPEQACVGVGLGTHGCRRSACSYGGGGINKSSPILVICQSLFQMSSLSQHA
jgi:hypothetical protein